MDGETGLSAVDGFPFPVLTSAGTEERGRAIGARVKRADEWLADVLGFRPDIRVLALAPDDWNRLAEVPVFGFPHFTGTDTIVVGSIRATFFGQIVEAFLPDISEATRDLLEETYGRPPLLDGFVDMLALHELGHLFHVQAGFWPAANWLPELFCNIGLAGYIAEVEPQELPVLETFPLAVREVRPEQMTFRRIDEMFRAFTEGGPLNYAWYELLLHAAAKDIWEGGGAEAFRRLYERFRDGPEPAPADLRRVLHDEVHPELARVMDEWPG